MRATVIADASYAHAGGIHFGSWAAWVRVDGMTRPLKGSGLLKAGGFETSTHAEILAVLNGAYMAHLRGARDILVQTDCMTVVQVLNREVRTTAKSYKFMHCAIRRGGLDEVRWTARHVKGHTRKEDARSHANRWCHHAAFDLMTKERNNTLRPR